MMVRDWLLKEKKIILYLNFICLTFEEKATILVNLFFSFAVSCVV